MDRQIPDTSLGKGLSPRAARFHFRPAVCRALRQPAKLAGGASLAKRLLAMCSSATTTAAGSHAAAGPHAAARYDHPKGHSYFRSGTKKGEPGLVFEHIFNTLLTGRVFPNDEYRKSSIIGLSGG